MVHSHRGALLQCKTYPTDHGRNEAKRWWTLKPARPAHAAEYDLWHKPDRLPIGYVEITSLFVKWKHYDKILGLSKSLQDLRVFDICGIRSHRKHRSDQVQKRKQRIWTVVLPLNIRSKAFTKKSWRKITNIKKNLINASWAPNLHIKMISKGSCE